jgi:hypothetical protein
MPGASWRIFTAGFDMSFLRVTTLAGLRFLAAKGLGLFRFWQCPCTPKSVIKTSEYCF